MIINITENFRVNADGHGNHQPEWFDKGGKEITVGKNAGQLTQPGWKREDLHYTSVGKAVFWGLKNGKIDRGSAIANEMSADECAKYLERMESSMKEIARSF